MVPDKNDPVREADKYISDKVAGFHDVGEIAWRFLLGNRILEYMDGMKGVPLKGTDFKVIQSNEKQYTLQLGDYIISIELDLISGMQASKPDGRQDKPIQPNSLDNKEDLGH